VEGLRGPRLRAFLAASVVSLAVAVTGGASALAGDSGKPTDPPAPGEVTAALKAMGVDPRYAGAGPDGLDDAIQRVQSAALMNGAASQC
jgi:hypothetical protein